MFVTKITFFNISILVYFYLPKILMRLFVISIGLFLFCFCCCNTAPRQPANRALYYWKTVFSWDEGDAVLAASLGIRKLYLRLFDVTCNEESKQPIPSALLSRIDRFPANMEPIPVVFITNEAFVAISDSLIPTLARDISKLVFQIVGPLDSRIREIQIDCDWNSGTRERYFTLLTALKSLARGRILSATIRLHQIKFREKTGIPPVDRGMLMVYNMGNPGMFKGRNSIIDLSLVRSYTDDLAAYPLPLDVVFPLFSWGVVKRNNGFAGLVRELKKSELLDNGSFRMIDTTSFSAVSEVRMHGATIRKGDVIRCESGDAATALSVANMIKGRLKTEHPTISLFHFDREVFDRNGTPTIKRIYETFE
jgi:hypothetical protein